MLVIAVIAALLMVDPINADGKSHNVQYMNHIVCNVPHHVYGNSRIYIYFQNKEELTSKSK